MIFQSVFRTFTLNLARVTICPFPQGQLSKEQSSRTQASSLTAELEGRLTGLQNELKHSREREEEATLELGHLNEKVSALEKEAASLTVELKAAQARYNQEVVAHQATEKSRILSKEEANVEVVKGHCPSYLSLQFRHNSQKLIHNSMYVEWRD